MKNNLDKKETKIIAGFLTSALDVEDDMSINFYEEFLNRQIWPTNLTDDVFEIIKKIILILIEETEGHKKIFLKLMEKINYA